MNENVKYQPGQYLEIDALIDAIARMNIRLDVRPVTADLEVISFSRIHLKVGALDETIDVEDEYGDAKTPKNKVILLNLILQSLEHFESSEDILEWSKGFSLEVGNPLTMSIFIHWNEIAPKLRDILGRDLKPLSAWDYTMNTTVTQILRSMEMPNG